MLALRLADGLVTEHDRYATGYPLRRRSSKFDMIASLRPVAWTVDLGELPEAVRHRSR